MTRNERDIRRLAERYHLEARHNGRHWFLRDADGRLVTTLARTPGNGSWLKFAERDVKRARRQAGRQRLSLPPRVNSATLPRE